MHPTKRKELSAPGIFYRRRDDWIKYVLRLPKAELSHVEKLVAIYIAETNNPKDRGWITSQEKIADDLDIGIRIVKSAVSKLRAAGLIETKRRRLGDNVKMFNLYSIVDVKDAVPPSEVHRDAPW